MELLALTFKSIIYEYTYESLLLILILSGPPIALASVLGLVVAIVQAATQIQEQTFAFAVKMVSIIITLIFMGGWLGALIHQFASQIFNNFHKLKQ